MKFIRESAIVVYYNESGAIETICCSLGSPGAVEFDFEALWEFKKEKKDFKPDRLGFFHVHPPGFDELSTLDHECLKGLDIALGSGFGFSIVNYDKSNYGRIKTFVYFRKEKIVKEAMSDYLPEMYMNWLKISSHRYKHV